MVTRIALFLACVAGAAHADAPASGHSADDALKRLVAGNAAFVAGGGACPRQTGARRADVATGQHPFAVIVGCADSRVPPEVLFDQGLGDLFVVRVAGNVIDDDIVGSIEYAVEHLGVSLVVVLGHTRCAAVQAALSDVPPGGHLDNLVARIRASVARVRGRAGDALDNAVRANVLASVQKLQTIGPVLGPRAKHGTVRVVGAHYDLESGAVEILPMVEP